jgi:hypothetical protein
MIIFNSVFEPIILGSVLILALLFYRYQQKLAWHFKAILTTVFIIIALTGALRFFQIAQIQIYHVHDLYHYVIGGKYFKYLGYDQLYLATAQALLDQGMNLDEVNIRNLAQKRQGYHDNWRELLQQQLNPIPASIWDEFKTDIFLFSIQLNHDPQQWQKIFNDHGFNPTPFWALQAQPILSYLPLQVSLAWLIYFDYVLIIITGLLLWLLTRDWLLRWAMLAIYWFVFAYYPAFGLQANLYTIGSFLRYTWFFYLSLGMILLAKSRYYSAGFFLALAGLERVFPFVFLFIAGLGLAVGLTRDIFTHSKVEMGTIKQSNLVSFSSGALSAMVLIVGMSLWAYPTDYFAKFASNISAHSGLFATNNVGYQKMVVNLSERPGYQTWSIASNDLPEQLQSADADQDRLFHHVLSQRYQGNTLAFAFKVGLIFTLALLAFKILPLVQSTWILGTAFIFYLTLMSYYYHAFLASYVAMVLLYQNTPNIAHSLYWLISCLIIAIFALLTPHIAGVSVIISVVLWFTIPLVITHYFLPARQQVLVFLGLVAGLALLWYMDQVSVNPQQSPYEHFNVEFTTDANQLFLQKPRYELLELNYLDNYARRIRQHSLILEQDEFVEFTVSHTEPFPKKPLQLILRSDFNYPVTLRFSVNGQVIRDKVVKRVGHFWGYETVVIPKTYLTSGENSFKIEVIEGKAWALAQIWYGYFIAADDF